LRKLKLKFLKKKFSLLPKNFLDHGEELLDVINAEELVGKFPKKNPIRENLVRNV